MFGEAGGGEMIRRLHVFAQGVQFLVDLQRHAAIRVERADQSAERKLKPFCAIKELR